MSVIEKLDSVLAKWRAREQRAEEQAMNSEQDYGNQSWYGGVSEAAGDCADELDALMPAIRQAMIDAERYRWLRDTQQLATTSDWLGVYPADSRNCYYGPRLDAAIDARLASDSEGGSDER